MCRTRVHILRPVDDRLNSSPHKSRKCVPADEEQAVFRYFLSPAVALADVLAAALAAVLAAALAVVRAAALAAAAAGEKVDRNRCQTPLYWRGLLQRQCLHRYRNGLMLLCHQ